MGSLARTYSLLIHRPLETDGVEQLMKPSWLRNLFISGGSHCDYLSQTMRPPNICHWLIKRVPAMSSSVLRNWASQAPGFTTW